jgi:predicted dehydrogenase
MFSIAPLLLIVVAVAGLVVGEEAARGEIYSQMDGILGAQGGLAGWLEKKEAAREESLRAGNADWIGVAEPDKGHARMLGAFVEEIRGLRPAPVSPVADAVQAVEICAAAIRSFREKRFVEIGELRDATNVA